MTTALARESLLRAAPLGLALVPGALAYGAAAGASVLGPVALAAVPLINTVSGQYAALTALEGAAPPLLAILIVAVVNSRHLLYGMSLATTLPMADRRTKVLAGYLLTDEAYAATRAGWVRSWAEYIQVGLMLLGVTLASSTVGSLLGDVVSASSTMSLMPDMALLAIAGAGSENRGSDVAIVAGAALAVLLAGTGPIGLLLAIGGGIAAGRMAPGDER